MTKKKKSLPQSLDPQEDLSTVPNATTEGATSAMPSAPTAQSEQENRQLAAFQSLVERSIQTWKSNSFATVTGKDVAIEVHSAKLRRLRTIDDVLVCREYWFFQTREHFMSQTHFSKWDPKRLDGYILLPIYHGFVNAIDCFFISHYWRTTSHPDPKGIDLALNRGDLRDEQWSCVWVDWTCMPQSPRNKKEDGYFLKMIRCIPLLVQHCAFTWRYPAFKPRAWILFEVTIWLLNHSGATGMTEDMAPFFNHVQEMVTNGVIPTLKKHRYLCTNPSDLKLVTGWMEIAVILFKTVQDIGARQDITDQIYKSWAASIIIVVTAGVKIDKSSGILTLNGKEYKFTPIHDLTAGH